MMLTHAYLSTPIKMKENEIPIWVVENPTIFAQLMQELLEQIEGEEGRFILSEKFEIIEPASNMQLITDLFSLNLNEKKIVSKIYNSLKEKSMTEDFLETSAIKSQISQYLELLLKDHDFPLYYHDDIDITALLKVCDVKIGLTYDSLLEKILDYMLLCRNFLKTKCFVFVNLKCFLSQTDLTEFYRAIHYEKLKVVLIESTVREERIESEVVRILDHDMCEID